MPSSYGDGVVLTVHAAPWPPTAHGRPPCDPHHHAVEKRCSFTVVTSCTQPLEGSGRMASTQREDIVTLTPASRPRGRSPVHRRRWDLRRDRAAGGRSAPTRLHPRCTHRPATSSPRVAGTADADFLVFGDQRWSFEQFFADVDALAAVLQHDMGVKPGDRIAIAMRNCPDWVLIFAAAVHVGAVAVLINSWGSAEELEFTLRDSDPTVLAADLPRTRLAADALRQRRMAVLFSDVDGGIRAIGPRLAFTPRRAADPGRSGSRSRSRLRHGQT